MDAASQLRIAFSTTRPAASSWRKRVKFGKCAHDQWSLFFPLSPLEAICETLECQPGEILEYRPETAKKKFAARS
jgi:hypothetical protein